MGPVSLLLALLGPSCVDYEIVRHDATDVFYQDPSAEVDILLVVDNSCSMQPYQEKLSQNFAQFISFFEAAAVDYQIGVVTTGVTTAFANPDAGCPQQVINNLPGAGELVDQVILTPETDGADALFTEVVNVGICGSGAEMGLEAAYLALTAPLINNHNQGFLREEAGLSLIFVSDEQDLSPRGVNDYTNAFREIKGQRERDIYNSSALVMTDMSVCTQEQRTYGSRGTRYLDVADQSSGITGNICDSDFESIVTELSLNSSRLLNTFFLSATPDPSTLMVTVDDEEIPCDAGVWTYQELEGEGVSTLDTGGGPTDSGTGGNLRPAVVFDITQVPPANSQIAIRYDSGFGGTEDWCNPTDDTTTDTAAGE